MVLNPNKIGNKNDITKFRWQGILYGKSMKSVWRRDNQLELGVRRAQWTNSILGYRNTFVYFQAHQTCSSLRDAWSSSFFGIFWHGRRKYPRTITPKNNANSGREGMKQIGFEMNGKVLLGML